MHQITGLLPEGLKKEIYDLWEVSSLLSGLFLAQMCHH